MKVKYFPKFDEKWVKLREVAYLAIIPDGYELMSSPLFWMTDIHGIGERGDCQLANLVNLYEGQLQPDNTRMYAYVTEATKSAVDKYGIIMIYPTYSQKEFFGYEMMRQLYVQVQNEFKVTSKLSLGGFSYGGGATINFASSMWAAYLTNAWPIAPTENVVDWVNTRAANIPMHFFVNDDDTNEPTNLSHTLKLVNGVNSSTAAPQIKTKAQYTAFRQRGHGDHNKVTDLFPPIAIGGQGIINLAENIYEWSIDCWKNGPRQMKTSTPNTPTIPNTPTMPTTAKADFNITDKQVITTSTFELDGSGSVGVINNNYYWEVTRMSPPWTGQVLDKGTVGGPKKKLSNLVDGPYRIRLTINGSVQSDVRRIEVKLGEVILPKPKAPIAYSAATDLIMFDDGSMETAALVIFKTESGKEYTI